MTVLDELSGFEFEDLMVEVFRELGYENVRSAERSSDMGRDVLMEEVVDGTRGKVIVECKHTDHVGRPVVQKLHSGISTYNYDGPKRGMIATSGRFSGPARDYAKQLRRRDDAYDIELMDGRDLRELSDEIGLDLKNGRIEILCNETLRPYDEPDSVPATVREVFGDVENIEAIDIPTPESRVVFRPVVSIEAATDAVFKTSVGVIHRINEHSQLIVHADRRETKVCSPDVSSLVADNLEVTTELTENRYNETFDDVVTKQFGWTKTEYKDWTIKQLQRHHTTVVTYTGDNNVTYNKTCEPNQSDVTIQNITPVYLPEIQTSTTIKEYRYPYTYHAAGPSRITKKDGIHQCVHCNTNGPNNTYTYCDNCGSINCNEHIETERLEGEPVCTGCAVTERFFLKTKYFYNKENLETFQEQYEEMPFYKKALENKLLVVAGFVTTILLSVAALVSLGVL